MQMWFGRNQTVYQHAWTTSEQGELQNKALPSTQKNVSRRDEGLQNHSLGAHNPQETFNARARAPG